MVGTSKPTDRPVPRVLDRAGRADLGAFKERIRRRPGFGGAIACLVILIVVMNFLVNGPEGIWARGAEVVGLLIVITWCYVWFRRVRGGLYLFSGGFVDVAGRRVIVVAWNEIRSIEEKATHFAIGSLPVGSASAYDVGFTVRATGFEGAWTFNTTYSEVHKLAYLISRRSGVPVALVRDPYDL